VACPRRASATHPASQGTRPPIEVADVFRAHGEDYRQHHGLTPDQLEVMRDIETCRTRVLGGHLDVCQACGFSRPAYNSCRNRHCPKCQAIAAADWIDNRMERILPVPYFHTVFTLPASLRPLCRRNPERLYNLLFQTASQTLIQLGEDPKRLGAQLGFTAVLHTWTRKLDYHVHLHCIVTGGGLSPAGDRWIPIRHKKYLFPVKVMAVLSRGKFLDGLRRLYDRGELTLGPGCAELEEPRHFARFLDRLYRQDWVVYAKQPFGGPEHVYRYLARYTHRVGLSNQRLLTFDERGVTFLTKNDDTATLAPDEFIRRFLQHVLPKGFSKIRHFGLMAPRHAKTRLEIARRLIAVDPPASATRVPPVEPMTWADRVLEWTGVDPRICPRCGGTLRREPLPSVESVPAIPFGADTS